MAEVTAYVCADDVDQLVAQLRAESVSVPKDPADKPWGERIAAIADPNGNPVATPGLNWPHFPVNGGPTRDCRKHFW